MPVVYHNLYREQWRKSNGWQVRAEILPAGGGPKLYGDRTITHITNVFKDVSGHKGGFEALPFGVSDAESCKFVINYASCPSLLQAALTDQFKTIATTWFGDATPGLYRVPTYFPSSEDGFTPQQPNLFMVWSDRGTGLGIPTSVSIVDGGTDYATTSGVNVGSIPPSGTMDLVKGSGLQIDYTTVSAAVATVHIFSTGSSGYTTGSGKTTSGGTGTGCTLAITANGSGKVTAITGITEGGTGYVVGDHLTITSGSGDAVVAVDSVGPDGVIHTITGLHGGRNYQVGDQVVVEAGNGDALIEITAIQDSTWYLEFAGGQRYQPSVKYKVSNTGLDIEVEAIGVHKLALEAINDLPTAFSVMYMPTQSDSGSYYYGAKYTEGGYTVTSPQIVDFEYYGNTAASFVGHVRQSVVNPFYHWHAPMGALWDFLDKAMTEALEYLFMVGYQGTSATNLTGVYPATDSNVQLWKPAPMYVLLNDLGTIAAVDGSLHTPASNQTQMRFIFCVTKGIQSVYGDHYQYIDVNFTDSVVGGLFSRSPDGIAKDCDNAWELLKSLHEQFFIKSTPYYNYDGTYMYGLWNHTQPYGSGYTPEIIEYTSGQGEETEFETNKDRVSEVKTHNYVQTWDVETWSTVGLTKSDKNIEMNHIFDIRYRTPKDENAFNASQNIADGFPMAVIGMDYANLRGIYTMYNFSGTSGDPHCALIGVSPRISIRYITSGTTETTETDSNKWYYYDANSALYDVERGDTSFTSAKIKSPEAFLKRMRFLNMGRFGLHGFQKVARVYLSIFGSYYDTTAYAWWNDHNNQTGYELTLPMQEIALPHRVGSQSTITPHPALEPFISSKSYLIEAEVDWTAKSEQSDLVKTKWLTRNINYD